MYNNHNNLFNINFIIDKLKIKEKQSIADLGCGNFGFFIWPIAKKVGEQGNVYAVDIIKNIIERISEKAKSENLPQIKTVWSNLEIFKATKIETNSLDTALLVNTLHQSIKKMEIIREATRLLKRGGKLLIVEWKDEDIPFGPNPENRIKVETIKNASSRLGLNFQENFEASPYHYGLILNKL